MMRTERSLPDRHRHPATASPLNAPKPVLSSSPAGVWRLPACLPIAATRQPSLPRAPSTRTPGLISMLLLAAEGCNPVRMNPGPPPRRIRQLLRDHVDHPAHGIGAVKDARRPANQLDTTHERRFDRGPVLITPRVILEPAAVLEHEHPRPREAANHRFPDLRAGAERAHAGQRVDDVGE